jgi:hypothetical protein
VFASLLHQGAEARLHDAGNRSRRASASNETGVDLVDVVIGFEKGEVQRGGISDLELLERGGLLGLTADGARSDFRRTNAVSMQIPASEVNSLRSTTGISFVEYDAKAFMHEDEIVTTRATQETNLPWGLAAIQANSKKIPLPLPSSDCFKICIVDSGLLVEHPDIVSRICFLSTELFVVEVRLLTIVFYGTLFLAVYTRSCEHCRRRVQHWST